MEGKIQPMSQLSQLFGHQQQLTWQLFQLAYDRFPSLHHRYSICTDQESKHQQGYNLTSVCLRGRHSYFWARINMHSTTGLSAD